MQKNKANDLYQPSSLRSRMLSKKKKWGCKKS